MSRSVEARGGTIDEAVREALRELELGREDVEVEVLSEGRRGLFGAARRAHVRVTAKAPHAEQTPAERAAEVEEVEGQETAMGGVASEIEDTRPEETEQGDGRAQGEEEALLDQIDEEADLAADFIEGLLDLLDLPGDIEIEVHEEQAVVTVQDVGSGLLIGRRGATLDALQELVRCAVQRQTERRSRVRVDVEGYRARHLEKLRDKCREAIAEVRETGEPVRLEPMDAYERKVMHDLVAKTRGVTSSSEGAEPRRRVVIHPEE